MHIAVVGLSHRTAPVEIREKLSIPEQTMETSLQSLRGNEQVIGEIKPNKRQLMRILKKNKR